LLDEFRGIAIVKMPKYHHGRMLGSPEVIKLVVITLAEIQEGLTIVQKLTIHLFCVIVD
jgi:hypothetical protein